MCLWRQHGDDRWHTGEIDFPDRDDPDGAARLFAVLAEGTPAAYQRFAEDYYAVAVDIDAVSEVFASRLLTDDLVRRLNRELTLADLTTDLAEIGYPSQPA